MKKKPLKVQAVRRIYIPKYPSYEDKNPLLHPEKQPYPFSLKFIKWASAGGLTSLMLLGGSEAAAQPGIDLRYNSSLSNPDSLYNPFPLENARVPYEPVSFGTGMPERLGSEEAVQVILKAFADSGIELDKDVWLEDGNIGVYLDGYSDEDKIGFVFLDYTNMDGTFSRRTQPKTPPKTQQKTVNKEQDILDRNINNYTRNRKNDFLSFVKDKDKFIRRLILRDSEEAKKRYHDNLLKLEPQKKSEKLFNKYHLQYDFERCREGNRYKLEKEVFQYIDNRFKDSVEKIGLLRFTYEFKQKKHYSSAYYLKMKEEFEKLKKIKSKKKFIHQYLLMYRFLTYHNNMPVLHSDTRFLELKLEIMNSYPLEEWFSHTEKFNEHRERSFLSLNDAKRIDEKNKKGIQFIAPISQRDRMLIVPSSDYKPLSDELMQEMLALNKEYSKRNGMTDEILAQRKAELDKARKINSHEKIKNLSKEDRRALNQTRVDEERKIRDKYKVMELLTDEERAEFKAKFEEINERGRIWRKKRQEELRIETLHRLEQEVKRYIKWAKSQMGG